MTILILERVPASLRGALSKWMIEPKAGVFVGRISGLVRDRLWEKACREAMYDASCVLIHSSNTEQGFAVQSYGDPTRKIVNIEGLYLVLKP